MKKKEKKQSLDELLEEIGRTSLLSHEEELALLKVVKENGTDCDEMEQLEKGQEDGVADGNPLQRSSFNRRFPE